ncbi:pyruvate formate-lyase-activating protein [Streptomyces sp. NPDC127077]|uniref:pyruvate formate-lyase-activating protein n=1 Tax=Streptomyces sp. NPDC127077 TaxID=3347131 RepID=UPI003664A66E
MTLIQPGHALLPIVSTDPDRPVEQAAPRRGTGPLTGSVHSWDVSTGVDGPGTRFVLFVAGCPLACLYCQNPDTLRMSNGKRATTDDVVAEAAKYVPFIRAAGGGFTVSGGEPMLQPDFVGEILGRCHHDLGLHTALDTSGFLGARATDAFLDSVDLVLLDIKSWDRELYMRLTSRQLEPTLVFARRLAELGKEVWVRFVLVPGLTDPPENVAGVAAFTASLGNVTRVDVLPFHKFGADKWAGLGMNFTLASTPVPSAAQIAEARSVFASYGLYAV